MRALASALLFSTMISSEASASEQKIKQIRNQYSAFKKQLGQGAPVVTTINDEKVTPGLGSETISLVYTNTGAVLKFNRVPYVEGQIEVLFDKQKNISFLFLAFSVEGDLQESRIYFDQGSTIRCLTAPKGGGPETCPAVTQSVLEDLKPEFESAFVSTIAPLKKSSDSSEETGPLKHFRDLAQKAQMPLSAGDVPTERVDPKFYASVKKVASSQKSDSAPKDQLKIELQFENTKSDKPILINLHRAALSYYVDQIEPMDAFIREPLNESDSMLFTLSADDFVSIEPGQIKTYNRRIELKNPEFKFKEGKNWYTIRPRSPGVFKMRFCFETSKAEIEDPKVKAFLTASQLNTIWFGTICDKKTSVDTRP